MAGRSASRVAYDDATSTHRDAYLTRIIDSVGTGDAALILRRIAALVEAGETGVSVAARLNGPARTVDHTPADSPFARSPRRTLIATSRDHTPAAAKPKTPPVERPPKPEPPKDRPVRRAPAPQRKGQAMIDAVARPIRKGRLIGSTQHPDGTRTQIIECVCGATYRRPYRPGRIPGVCESCR